MKQKFQRLVRHLYTKTGYRIVLCLTGLITWLAAFVVYQQDKSRHKDENQRLLDEVRGEMEREGATATLKKECEAHLRNKLQYFGTKESDGSFQRELEKLTAKTLRDEEERRMAAKREARHTSAGRTYVDCLVSVFDSPALLVLSVILSLPMYILLVLCLNPFVKYTVERVFMMIFVTFGVVFVVFTILYFSPMDSAVNILGESATEQQIAEFNKTYGLDQPYIVQLFSKFKNLVTFNLGKSYSGNEDVGEAILRKFPVTLEMTLFALILAIVISIPIGIISAVKQYTAGDYFFMFLALVGISIPEFWFGMMLILTFSINLGWLPSTYVAGNLSTLIMPSIVAGTYLAASLTRMTRSSLLEVINQDYIVTAYAKGLSKRTVIIKHALGNALIPIITVIGLQFGSMLGGSAVIEKVFTIKGIGNYIVEKQFLPDIPVILACVIYVAIIISVVNLLVDLIYVLIDPRIKSRIKNQ